MANSLGVLNFGLYTLSLAYFSLISAVSEFGFNRFLVREVAKDKSQSSELVWNIAFLRLAFAAVLFAIFAVTLYFLDHDKLRVSLTLLALVAVLPQSIGLTLDAVFVAFKKLQFSAISILILSLSTAVLGIILISQGFGPMGAVNALIFGQLIYVVALFIFLYSVGLLDFSSIKSPILKKIFMGSLPYGLLGILGFLYFRIDTVLLSYIRGNFETGIYGAAYRFLEAVVFVPSALATALFPVMTNLHSMHINKIRSLYFKSMKIMLLVSLIVVFGYLLILPIVIRAFLPAYLPSIDAIRVLSFAIPFMFLQFPASAVVLSSEKYLKPIIFLSLVPLSFNILMNLIFIPSFGFMAASWITVASDILSFLMIFIFIQKYVFKHA